MNLSTQSPDHDNPDSLTLDTAARNLESLGSPKRLAVFRLLIKAGPAGLPVGEVQRALEIAPSTLTHHIGHLVQCGLIDQVKEGRVLRCIANYRQMTQLIEYLLSECCQGSDPCGVTDCE